MTDRSLLAPENLVPGVAGPSGEGSCGPSFAARHSPTAPLPSAAPEPPRATSDCVEIIEWAACHQGLSSGVAQQLALCRRWPACLNYQGKWSTYHSWCRSLGHSISRPSISKVSDFLLFLRRKKFLTTSNISGYRSMLSAVFRFSLPELSSSTVLKDLLRSFRLEQPSLPVRAPPWDLSLLLQPLQEVSLFLLSLATARRVEELQAISKTFFFWSRYPSLLSSRVSG